MGVGYVMDLIHETRPVINLDCVLFCLRYILFFKPRSIDRIIVVLLLYRDRQSFFPFLCRVKINKAPNLGCAPNKKVCQQIKENKFDFS